MGEAYLMGGALVALTFGAIIAFFVIMAIFYGLYLIIKDAIKLYK